MICKIIVFDLYFKKRVMVTNINQRPAAKYAMVRLLHVRTSMVASISEIRHLYALQIIGTWFHPYSIHIIVSKIVIIRTKNQNKITVKYKASARSNRCLSF